MPNIGQEKKKKEYEYMPDIQNTTKDQNITLLSFLLFEGKGGQLAMHLHNILPYQ